MTEKEQPYILEKKEIIIRKYNPKYGDERVCVCGHTYYRHFDSYEKMERSCGASVAVALTLKKKKNK